MKRNLNVTGKARKICIRHMWKTKEYPTEVSGKRTSTTGSSEQGPEYQRFQKKARQECEKRKTQHRRDSTTKQPYGV